MEVGQGNQGQGIRGEMNPGSRLDVAWKRCFPSVSGGPDGWCQRCQKVSCLLPDRRMGGLSNHMAWEHLPVSHSPVGFRELFASNQRDQIVARSRRPFAAAVVGVRLCSRETRAEKENGRADARPFLGFVVVGWADRLARVTVGPDNTQPPRQAWWCTANSRPPPCSTGHSPPGRTRGCRHSTSRALEHRRGRSRA